MRRDFDRRLRSLEERMLPGPPPQPSRVLIVKFPDDKANLDGFVQRAIAAHLRTWRKEYPGTELAQDWCCAVLPERLNPAEWQARYGAPESPSAQDGG